MIIVWFIRHREARPVICPYLKIGDYIHAINLTLNYRLQIKSVRLLSLLEEVVSNLAANQAGKIPAGLNRWLLSLIQVS
jgi:hypothetical protein